MEAPTSPELVCLCLSKKKHPPGRLISVLLLKWRSRLAGVAFRPQVRQGGGDFFAWRARTTKPLVSTTGLVYSVLNAMKAGEDLGDNKRQAILLWFRPRTQGRRDRVVLNLLPPR